MKLYEQVSLAEPAPARIRIRRPARLHTHKATPTERESRLEWITQFTNDGHGGMIPVSRKSSRTGEVQLPVITHDQEGVIASLRWRSAEPVETLMDFATLEARVLASQLNAAPNPPTPDHDPIGALRAEAMALAPSSAADAAGYVTGVDRWGEPTRVERRSLSPTGRAIDTAMVGEGVGHSEAFSSDGIAIVRDENARVLLTSETPTDVGSSARNAPDMDYNQGSSAWAVTRGGDNNIVDVSSLSVEDRIRVQTLIDLAEGRATAKSPRYTWTWTWKPWAVQLAERFVAARARVNKTMDEDYDGALWAIAITLMVSPWMVALFLMTH